MWRCKGEGKCREGQMSSEGWRIWSIKIGCATSWSTHQVSPFWWFYGYFLTPLILIRQLTHYDSHTALRQYPLLIESSHCIKSSFHFYLNFPMMSHCVSFYYSFSFDLSSDSSCCSEKELSGIFLWLNWWAIAYRSQKCLLSRSGFPMYIRRLSCLRERTIKFRFYS